MSEDKFLLTNLDDKHIEGFGVFDAIDIEADRMCSVYPKTLIQCGITNNSTLKLVIQ